MENSMTKNTKNNKNLSDFYSEYSEQNESWTQKNLPMLGDYLSALIGENINVTFTDKTSDNGRLILVGKDYLVLSDAANGKNTAYAISEIKSISSKKS